MLPTCTAGFRDREGDVPFQFQVAAWELFSPTTQHRIGVLEREEHTMNTQRTPIVMEDVTDAEQLAQARQQRERFNRNSAWLQTHIAEVYTRHRGKCICIAGEELFVADTATEAISCATAAHPEDDGWFTRYIPKDKVARIYAV